MKKFLKKLRPITDVSPLVEPDGVKERKSTSSNFEAFAIASSTSQLLEEADAGTNKTIYALSLVNRYIGINNFWRFPFMAYIHNGGSFFWCYVFLLITVGIPMQYLEACLGQFTSKGLPLAFHCIYLLNGLRYAMGLVNFYMGSYISIFVSYLFKYWLFSFSGRLPWDTCKGNYTKMLCIDTESPRQHPCSNNETKNCENAIFSTEHFWNRQLLLLPSFSDLESKASSRGSATVFVVMAWLVLFGMLTSPISRTGKDKVIYFTSTAPYMVLCLLMVNNFSLNGAGTGVYHLFTPKLVDLFDGKVWKAAASQVLISLMISTGGLIHSSSFGSFQNNCFADTFLIVGFNFFVSILLSITVFSYIGHQAFLINRTVSNVLQNASGVSFIAFSGSVSNHATPQIWAVAFYGLFSVVSLNNLFWELKAVVSVIRNDLPEILKRKQWLSVMLVCSACFLFTFVFNSKTSQERIYLFDYFAVSYPVLIIAVVEVMSITYIYGTKAISQDIKMMTGDEPHWIIKKMWEFCTPALLVIILIVSIVQERGLKLGNYVYPTLSYVAGWFLCFSSIIFIPAKFIYHVRKKPGQGLTRIKNAMKPHYKWRPYQREDRMGRYGEHRKMSIPRSTDS